MLRLRLFDVNGGGAATEITARLAERERHLQDVVEGNMELLLGVRFLASEYSTGPVHGGRIDTLGIDENGAPVVVELKRGTDPGVINQGLYYLAWLVDHRAEFQFLVRSRLGADVAAQVQWNAPRLICVAGGFSRYDMHAVREHRHAIDLVSYRLLGDSMLSLETVASVAGRTVAQPRRGAAGVSVPKPVAGGAMTELRAALDEVLVGLGEDVTQVERKQYRAYRRLRNFACVGSTQKRQVLVTLNVDPSEVDLVPGFSRDVSELGHHGTGDLEVRLRTERDLDRAHEMLRLSYASA
ncbi:DUF5655 domain-containing protein [Streptomyces sp. NPDC051561]|uniref:DUF5655 domain-containing protein n=1 Tax=Streptomyces sp. NPDC051561 TaxID=3365658 RepID=UPI0037B7F5B2